MGQDLFEKAPVPKAFFHFALPVVMGMVITLVYNMTDTYFIAMTGNTNLVAGVSLGTPIFTLMIALGDICGLGGSSAISRLFGQKDNEHAKKISVFCFYAAIMIGTVMTAILLVFRMPILSLLGANQETIEYAKAYYTWLAIGAPFIILTFTPNNQLRAEGLAKESMYGSILGSVVNIILDPILILALNMGAGGAAIATVIGNIVSDIYYVWVLNSKTKYLSINPAFFTITFMDVKDILTIGIPASITNLMQSFAIMMTNRSLLPYGNDKIAAWGVSSKILMIAALVLVGFAFGGQPLFGYNYGAKNYTRLRQVIRFSYSFEVGLGVGLSVILAVIAPWMIGLFELENSVSSVAIVILRFQLTGIVFMSLALVSTCIFQSTGKAFGAFCLSVGRQGIIFIIVLLIMKTLAGYQGILLSQPIADALTSMFAIILFRIQLYPEIK